MAATKAWAGILPVALLLSACQATDGANVFEKPLDFLSAQAEKIQALGGDGATEEAAAEAPQQRTLAGILKGSAASVDLGKGFSKSIAAAVMSDPSIIAAADEVDALAARVEATRSQKDFQFNGSLYGGVEDVSDETSGVAAVLSANRMIFDGGKIDAQISADEQRLIAARHSLQARMDERALQLASIWVDLDRYEKLNGEIESRLMILNPLIEQLEKVASAGVGDVTQVAAAQRTVSAIRVTQTDVAERLAQTRVSFVNAFGSLPARGSFEGGLVANKVPTKISDEMERAAPALLAQYARYLAAEADLATVKARKSFDLGFETRLSKPFGGSEFDSKESIGLVLRKNFYDGGQLDADEARAAAAVEGAIAQINATYREGERSVKTAQQTIKSMDKAIALAKDNATVTADEIAYLRKQLVIGGSTLDSVLSAEARLYEAESKEINFQADKYKAQLTIISALGLLSKSFGLSANPEQS
jgi:outer membrane protein TolC